MKNNVILKKYSLWFIMPAMILYLVFFAIPNIAGFVFGFTDWSINRFNDIQFSGLDNFRQMFSTPYLKKAIFNTFLFTILTGVLKNILGFLLALGANQKLKIQGYIRTVFFVPCIISPMVVGIIFSAIYNPQYGFLNTFLRFIGLGFLTHEWLVDTRFAMLAICAMEIWQWTGFCMVIFLAGLQSIPADYYDASKIDGAKYMQQVRHIILPLVMPAITVSVLLSLIGGLKVFTQVYSLTNGGPMDETQVISTLIYKSFSDGLLGYSAAIGFLFTIIVTIVSFIILKMFRKMEVEY